MIKLVDERTETLENKYLALRNIHNITLKTGELVAEENKRYKQYLELIRSTGTHGKDVQTNEVLRSDEAELANEAIRIRYVPRYVDKKKNKKKNKKKKKKKKKNNNKKKT